MNKQNLILGGMVAVWIAILLIVIEFKSRTALFILPIFTVGAVLYLTYVTFRVSKSTLTDGDKNKEQNKNEN